MLNHLCNAGGPEKNLVGGEYCTPVGVGVMGRNNPFSHDVEGGRKPWDRTEEQVSKTE